VPGFIIGVESRPDKIQTEYKSADIVTKSPSQGGPYKSHLLVIAPYDFHTEHLHTKRLTTSAPEVSEIEKLEQKEDEDYHKSRNTSNKTDESVIRPDSQEEEYPAAETAEDQWQQRNSDSIQQPSEKP